ncbi:MAG: hypothetical protein IKO64_02435 [Kiritimatiellae bacterium]|nr:hypothetical protein [Kiritimatiellia bacterium]
MVKADIAIGGYFGMDPGTGASDLPNGILLNSGRNALRHIVRMLGIKRIHVPHYICPVVADALDAEHCELLRYALTDDMLPAEIFPKNDYVLYVNYFGVCGLKVDRLASLYPKLIVDCAQAYFAKPKGLASCASPRKFFGVPDGGVAFGVEAATYDEDGSDARKEYLLERRDNGATPRGYELFHRAEASLDNAEVLAMSQFTKTCLSKVDSRFAKKRRMENFAYLQACLPTSFPLAMADDDVPMVYPYMMDDPQLRTRLIQQKIYVASYWPGVQNCGDLPERILPLPIDQRYGETDMQRIVEAIISQGEGV